MGLIPGSGKSPGVGNSNSSIFTGKFHGEKSLAGYTAHGTIELDRTEYACILLHLGGFTALAFFTN